MALSKSQRSLKSWTKQKWRTKSGKPSTQGPELQEKGISQAKQLLHFQTQSIEQLLELNSKSGKWVSNLWLNPNASPKK